LLPSSSSFASSFSSTSDHSSPERLSTRSRPSASSAFQPYARRVEQKQKPKRKTRQLFHSFHDNFLESDSWISFDDSKSRNPTNYFATSR
jgi:hypothetical protein